MTKITAADVNKLRQTTGVGMMDCKKALIEAEGNFDNAIEILRKKGQKVADKRADRAANEGVVLAKINNEATFAAVVMLNSETDFVAKNEEVINLTQEILNHAIDNKIESLEDLKNSKINDRNISDIVTDMIGKTGEKLSLSRYETIEGTSTFAYTHSNNKLASIAAFNKKDVPEQIGKDVVMQITAMSPVAVDKDGVPKEIIDKELEVGKDQARQEGKPEELLEKIAVGKLNKFYKEKTLLNQESIKESKKTVKQILEEVDKDLTVKGFKRLALGE